MIKDSRLHIKEYLPRRAALESITAPPRGPRTGPDSPPPTLPGNLGMFMTQRYAATHGTAVPQVSEYWYWYSISISLSLSLSLSISIINSNKIKKKNSISIRYRRATGAPRP